MGSISAAAINVPPRFGVWAETSRARERSRPARLPPSQLWLYPDFPKYSLDQKSWSWMFFILPYIEQSNLYRQVYPSVHVERAIVPWDRPLVRSGRPPRLAPRLARMVDRSVRQ